MSDASETVLLEMKRLQERNLYLEECHLRFVSVLEMLSSSCGFQADLNRNRDNASILRTTLQQIKRLLVFTYMGFYINSDENDFELVEWDHADSKGELEREVEAKIMDGGFAWAINQNRPVLYQTLNSKNTLIMHVLSTQSRIRGMFVGILPGSQSTVDPSSLNALSIILSILHMHWRARPSTPCSVITCTILSRRCMKEPGTCRLPDSRRRPQIGQKAPFWQQ